LFELSQDEQTRALYDAREKARWDEHARMVGAEAKGKKEGAMLRELEIAKNALAMGLPIEHITALTGLDIETISALKAGE